jgi:hypothetical protein
MLGVLTGTVVEVATGKSFAEQLGWNLTHGVSALVVGAVIVTSCLPSFLEKSDGETDFGSGACKWKRDATARAERGYLVDPIESRRARAPRERHRVGENRMGAFRGVVKRTTSHVDDHGVVRG